MDDRKTTPPDNVILKNSNGEPSQTDRSNHNRNYNLLLSPDHDLSILCYFLAAISPLKVSFHVHEIKYMFTNLLRKAGRKV